MKKLIFSTTIFLILFTVGCQENSITDPVQQELQKTDPSILSILNQTTGENFTSGVIPLEGLLVLRSGFQTYYEIQGQINYTHELILLDPMPPSPQYYIDLNLSVIANLTDGNNRLNISSESNDNIYLSKEGTYILQKVFEVVGNNNQLSLICKFLVTTNGIGLSEMFLVEGYVNPGLNKNIEPDLTYPPVVNNQIN